MRVKHKSRPKNGPQHTTISNLIPRHTRKPQTQAGSQPSDLVEGLRWWADHYDWDEPDFRTHRLKLELAFEDSVTGAFYQFIADGQNALASLVKDEFGDLMERVKPLDLMYAERIDTQHDLRKLEEMKLQVGEVLCGLATMLENGYRTEAEGQEPEPSGSEKVSKTEWVTYSDAAELLFVDKSTICRWVGRGILESNGKNGRWLRVSKGSVLIKERQDAAD